MSKVEVLVATMHQPKGDYSLLERLNIQSDAVVVNQCDRNATYTLHFQKYNVLWIDSTERGLSRSRNLALRNLHAEIGVICDEDELLSDGYPLMIENAYNTIPQAGFIAFNITRFGWNEEEQPFSIPRKISFFKTYSSVHITFKRASIADAGIIFDTRFGAGSGMYACSEDAIFCMDCHKAQIPMYTFPGCLCSVNCEQSTWFEGYTDKYFFDVGAYLAHVFPYMKWILKWYYPWRCRKLTNLGIIRIIAAIHDGFEGYKRQCNFEEYGKYRHEKQ